jgi:hypothetical protein
MATAMWFLPLTPKNLTSFMLLQFWIISQLTTLCYNLFKSIHLPQLWKFLQLWHQFLSPWYMVQAIWQLKENTNSGILGVPYILWLNSSVHRNPQEFLKQSKVENKNINILSPAMWNNNKPTLPLGIKKRKICLKS